MMHLMITFHNMYNIELLFILGPTGFTRPAGVLCTPSFNGATGATGASGANVAPRFNGAAGATDAAGTPGATQLLVQLAPLALLDLLAQLDPSDLPVLMELQVPQVCLKSNPKCQPCMA